MSKFGREHLSDTVWHEIFAGVYFCELAIFSVLRELIFEISPDRLAFLTEN